MEEVTKLLFISIIALIVYLPYQVGRIMIVSDCEKHDKFTFGETTFRCTVIE